MKTVSISSSVDSSTKLQKIIDSTGNQPAKFVFSPEHFIEIDSLLRFYNYATVTGCGCTFRLRDNAPITVFGLQVPLIGSKYKQGIAGLIFEDFTVDGNFRTQAPAYNVYKTDHGKGFHNAIGLGWSTDPQYANVTNCVFRNLTLSYSQGDGVRIDGGSNLTFKNIKSEWGGHDVLHLSAVNGADVSGLDVKMRTNNAVRTRSSTNIDVHDCYVFGDTGTAYAPAFQSESITKNRTSSKIRYFRNVVKGTWGPAFWVIGSVPGASDMQIFNNLVTECGKMPASNKIPEVGGIMANGWPGVDIRYNTFVGCLGYAVAAGRYVGSTTQSGSLNIYRNIITGTRRSLSPGTASGTAIANLTGSQNKVTASENCLWNNLLDTYNVVNQNGLKADPQFIGNGNYHLRPSSPCRFPGYQLGCYEDAKEVPVGLLITLKESNLPDLIKIIPKNHKIWRKQ